MQNDDSKSSLNNEVLFLRFFSSLLSLFSIFLFFLPVRQTFSKKFTRASEGTRSRRQSSVLKSNLKQLSFSQFTKKPGQSAEARHLKSKTIITSYCDQLNNLLNITICKNSQYFKCHNALKLTYGGLVLGSSQFLLLPKPP